MARGREDSSMNQGAGKGPVVFFGSGPVAAKSLELLAQNFEVEAVVTKPKPAHHHGDFPVLDASEKLGLRTYAVSNKAELSALISTKPFASEVGVLIDFGIIVSRSTIDYFPKGIVNSHFSLLPEWRGADPISFAILSGQKQSGVSLMLLVEAMDEGPIVAMMSCDILLEETTASLTARLIDLSSYIVNESLPKYLNGEIIPVPQETAMEHLGLPFEPTYSRKLTKEDGQIDWSEPAEVIERQIRAFIEWPKSHTTFAGKDVIITKAHISEETSSRDWGSVFKTEEKELAVQTGEGLLVIDGLKPTGKKEMTAKEFLAGYGAVIDKE